MSNPTKYQIRLRQAKFGDNIIWPSQLCDNCIVSLGFNRNVVAYAVSSENACACKAASVVKSTLSVSRSREFPFLLYRCKLENVAVSFVFE